MSRIDPALLRRSLTEATVARLADLEMFPSIASTNTHLLAKESPPAEQLHVAIADHQTSGRGRHARRWLSPPGSGLCLSVAYTFAEQPEQLPGLTLAVGVGLVAALDALSVPDVRLKWPNDLVAADRKLGGVLTEVQSRPGPEVTVVVGVGLNVNLPERFDAMLDSGWAQAPTDLAQVAPGHPPRELLAATIIDNLGATMAGFGDSGFTPFIDAWRAYDWLAGKVVSVEMPERTVTGTACGVDAGGALLVDTGAEQVRVVSGSVVIGDGAET